jgi:hypothetical protein
LAGYFAIIIYKKLGTHPLCQSLFRTQGETRIDKKVLEQGINEGGFLGLERWRMINLVVDISKNYQRLHFLEMK